MNFEPEDDRLDQSLRSKFEQFAPPPTGKVWPGIAPHIGPPPQPRRRRRPLPLPFLFGLTALLAGLAGWLLPHGPAAPATSVAAVRVDAAGKPEMAKTSPGLANPNSGMANRSSGLPNLNTGIANLNSGTANLNTGMTNPGSGLANPNTETANLNPETTNPNSGVANPTRGRLRLSPALAIYPDDEPRRNSRLQNTSTEKTAGASAAVEAAAAVASLPQAGAATASVALPVAADSLPTTLRPLVALERRTLVQLPSIATLAAGPREADDRTTLLTTLRTERAELLRLQRRTDSLLLALGDLPGNTAVAKTDSASHQPETQHPTPNTRKWSLLLTATPEQNTLTLQGPENDPLTALRRNHETGRAGFSAAALAEYQLTPRVSVGGGLGYSTFGADLRVTNKQTDVSVTYNTTTTTSTNVYTSTNQTYSVRIIQVPQQSPIFNSSGQVIGYQTVYVPQQDTVYSTIVQHDTVRTTSHVTTPLISKKETLTTKLLQPTYRFATLPVLLRYRLAAPGTSRLWTDVALGAQLQFFLGGTQVVTDDGETFRTQSVTAGNGPFRPFNVSLSGSLALNYALTPRLSVSVAPSMRWQALSLYKAETGLRQQPTATGLMFGVRFGL